MKRALLVGLLFPILGALVLCTVASLWPVRLDARALQDLSRVQGLGLPTTSGNFVFLSRDNSIESARTATFGLRQLAFPEGSVFWAALKENCDGPWMGGFCGVDATGNAYAISVDPEGSVQWSRAGQGADDLRERVTKGYLLYDSYPTREAFEQRCPFLKAGERVAVLTDAPPLSSFKLRRPASEFGVKRVSGIAAVLGSYAAVILVLIQWPSLQRVDGWLITAGAVFLTVGLNLSVAYLLQWVAPALVPWTPLLSWGVLLSSAVLTLRVRGEGRDGALKLQMPSPPAVRLALIYCLAVYALLFLVRLDFDGDFFNNWLPQGRFHYLLGRHDPAAIMGQRSMQGASYPPGYGILLSTLMSTTGMKPAESFLMGPDSSFAILMYRLFVVALNAAFLLLLVTYVKKLGTSQSGVWLASVALTLLLIPSTAGKHIASETLLFPMMASAIVLLAAGQREDAPGLSAMGLAIGGMATLMKTEATLIFGLAVLPWLLSDALPSIARASRRVKEGWVATLLLSLVPVLLWKATLKVHNEFFQPVTWSRFVSSVHSLPGLSADAVRSMLDDGRFVFLILGLPCAIILRLRNSPKWTTVVVPLGIVSLFVGFIVIFLFATTDPRTYLDTSYSRLVMVPTFGAILYCAEAVQLSRSQLREPTAVL